jgi:hypothetical protein
MPLAVLAPETDDLHQGTSAFAGPGNRAGNSIWKAKRPGLPRGNPGLRTTSCSRLITSRSGRR